MKILVTIYTHPEGYPPTFNAINNLSKEFDSVDVVATKSMDTRWSYDKNVNLHLTSTLKNRFEFSKVGSFKKFLIYYKFIKTLHKQIVGQKVDIILIYDSIAFLFYLLASLFIPKSKRPKIWYHNHDIADISIYKKYSIAWFAAYYEQKKLHKAHYFSLPSEERKKYFPMEKFNGSYFFIPNYPSKYFHGTLEPSKKNKFGNEIHIVYPGNICFKHGFEELISVLNTNVNGKCLKLNLIGDVEGKYKSELLSLAKENSVENQIIFHDRVSYFDIPELISNCHIGWAVNKPLDITYATGGTAANKIYEFIALGMPIILFDSTHYKSYLEGNDWAHFTNLSKDSILTEIKKIDDDYYNQSQSARLSFMKEYSFEKAFVAAVNSIKSDL